MGLLLFILPPVFVYTSSSDKELIGADKAFVFTHALHSVFLGLGVHPDELKILSRCEFQLLKV